MYHFCFIFLQEAREIDPVHAKVFSKLEKQENAELTALRGMDKVNPKSKAVSKILKKKFWSILKNNLPVLFSHIAIDLKTFISLETILA